MSGAAPLRVTAAPIPARRGAGSPDALSAWWLGQAGFLLEAGGARVLIDPYLSDTLAEKYRGTRFPHVRLAPPPIEPGALRDVDLVLATHAHTDHLDPGTLGPLAAANPGCRFVVPAAHGALAVSRGVPPDRLVPASAFAPLALAGVAIRPLPAAHEAVATDAAGEHLFLGYVLEVGGATVYHSGDCVPHRDLLAHLARAAGDLGGGRPAQAPRIDLALLPVNGRDAARAAAGVPGNFTLDEALDLAIAAGFGASVGHHFGLFDFNGIDVAAAQARLAARPGRPPFLLAAAGVRYDLPARPVSDLPQNGKGAGAEPAPGSATP